MRAVRPAHLVVAVVLALFVGPLTGVGAASAETTPRVIDTFDSATGATGAGFETRTITTNQGGSTSFSGGSVKVTVPLTNNNPNVVLTWTAATGTSVDLTAGGADQLRVAYDSITSTRTPPSAALTVSVTGTDVNGKTRFANTGSTSNTDGFLSFGFGNESYQFNGPGDLTKMRSLQLSFFPGDNQGGSSTIDMTSFFTVNPDGVPGPTKTNQTITFAPPASPVAIGSTTSLSANATSQLPVTFTTTTASVCTVSGASVTAIAAGTCTIAADQAGNSTYNAAPQVIRTITVDKNNQTITFAQPTSPVAIGSATLLSATATSGQTVALTSLTTAVCRVVNGQAVADHAGTCTIAADQAGNSTYNAAPRVTRTITVDKNSQTITFPQPTSPVAIGSSTRLSATATSQLAVSLATTTPGVCTLSGTDVTATHAGTCTVTADQAGNSDVAAAPTVTRSFDVSKTSQTITFAQPTGPAAIGSSTPLTATASSGLSVTLTSLTTDVCRVVNGQAVADHAGTCTITATQPGDADRNAATPVNRSFDVDKTAQAVGFTSQAPSPAYVGATYTVSATGGAGTAPVTFSSTTPTTCSVTGSTVRFTAAGPCTVRADQASDADHSAAPPATQTITVTRVPATVTVALDPTTTVFGQRVTATAVVSPASGTATGTVQFSVDGTPAGAPVTVSSGRATSTDLAPLDVGSRTVTAVFTPADTTTYAPATGTGTLAVTKAATSATVRVEPTALVADVAAVAPGAGTPSGTVELRVDGAVIGTATLVNGTARLPYTVTPGASRAVAAAYNGDTRFTASSTSTARRDPTITAALTSPSTRSASGWYAGPVTVTFTCTTPGAALTSPCPSPVVLDRDGAGQSVSRTITTTDGGAATATVSGINIDTVAPRVKLTGLRRGAQHVATTPKAPRCKATDSLSGVLTCTVEKRTTKTANGTRIRYRAVATDLAGNTTSSTRGTKVASLGLDGVDVVRGVYQTRAGSSYTLVALGTAPRYRYAAPAPGAPHGGNVAMTRAGTVNGKPRWTIGIAITPAMRSHRYWNLGIVQDGKLRTIRIRVS